MTTPPRTRRAAIPGGAAKGKVRQRVGDYHELQEMGFSVSLFSDSERVAVQNLFKTVSTGKLVELVLPAGDQEVAEP